MLYSRLAGMWNSFTQRVGKTSKWLFSLADTRDVLVFGGLAMMGYGLHLYQHWLGFAIPGFFCLLIGFLWRPPNK
jgi:hypothetical protein